MTALFGKTLDELRAMAQEMGQPAYVGNQLARAFYKRWVNSFDQITDLSQEFRKSLSENFELGFVAPVRVDSSIDGTKKYLFPVDKKYIESAYIPEAGRKTLCVSSQAGCKMGCLFCLTGKQGFQKHLSVTEILNQIRSIPESRKLTNIVYMGMGEPLDNLENTLKSLEILTADWGLGFSAQRITVSSVGLLPALEEFFRRSKVRFALSLHSPFDEERASLMPVQLVHRLQEIVEFLRQAQRTDSRRLSIEYICFDGLNDTPRHIKELVKILHGIKIRINLIRFHTIPETPLVGSKNEPMINFCKALNAKGIPTTIRRSRGQDIWAACGLLSTKALLLPSHDRDF